MDANIQNPTISEETYKAMKKLVQAYEKPKLVDPMTQAYLREFTIKEKLKYNPLFGDDKICKCGHPYYRHFDTYEDMCVVGCKYCSCFEFRLKKTK